MGVADRNLGKLNDKLLLPLKFWIQGVRVAALEGARIDYGDEEKN